MRNFLMLSQLGGELKLPRAQIAVRFDSIQVFPAELLVIISILLAKRFIAIDTLPDDGWANWWLHCHLPFLCLFDFISLRWWLVLQVRQRFCQSLRVSRQRANCGNGHRRLRYSHYVLIARVHCVVVCWLKIGWNRFLAHQFNSLVKLAIKHYCYLHAFSHSLELVNIFGRQVDSSAVNILQDQNEKLDRNILQNNDGVFIKKLHEQFL